MENLGTAETVADLIALLKTLDPTLGWYGWDDGSIILEDLKTRKDIGFIENRE